MPQYVRLLEDLRPSRRTIADAIEVLRELVDFNAKDGMEVRVGLIVLPSAKVVGLIDVQYVSDYGEKVYLVSLPTSAHFRAIRHGSSKDELFEISELDGAVVDGARNVTLADGTVLRAVEAVPMHLPYEPSDIDWRIVYHTIAILGAEERCFRLWPDGKPFRFGDQISQKPLLDCSTLLELEPPPLKVLAHAIGVRDPSLSRLSLQKISDTLAMFGIRPIRPRPRRG